MTWLVASVDGLVDILTLARREIITANLSGTGYEVRWLKLGNLLYLEWWATKRRCPPYLAQILIQTIKG